MTGRRSLLTFVADRRRRRGSAGFTLIELLVVIIISGILMSAVTATAVLAQRGARGVGTRLNNLAESRTAMQELSRKVRYAISIIPASADGVPVGAFDAAGSTDVTFYSYVPNPDAQAPVKVRVYYDTSDPKQSKLTEQVWYPMNVGSDSTISYPSTPTITRTLARYVVLPPAAPGDPDAAGRIFRYYGPDGTEIPLTGTPPRLNDDQELTVTSVQITIRTQQPDNPQEPGTSIVNRVWVPNKGWVFSS